MSTGGGIIRCGSGLARGNMGSAPASATTMKAAIAANAAARKILHRDMAPPRTFDGGFPTAFPVSQCREQREDLY
jgi:hypothetical protein